MKIFLPQAVKKCISVLENAGYEAFCVGGAVRDMIMGLSPSDFDVTTNCPPKTTQELFERSIPTGIEHGTVTVICDKMPIEVTTYRTEGGYTDSRHPDSVRFVGNIKDDLSRRDFTVNAIAYNEKPGFFDPFGGIADIEDRTLRTVGKASRRFSEDALRIMRLYRFASQLDFAIEDQTGEAARQLLPLLQKISAERIFAELKKMLCGKNAENAAEFFALGGLEFLGLRKCNISGLCSLQNDISVRFAALMILSGSDADVCLKNLKADNRLKDEVLSLNALLQEEFPKEKVAIKRALCRYGEDILEKGFSLFSILKKTDTRAAKEMFEEILNNGEPYRLCHLKIGGDDIASAGYKGREIGEIFDLLLSRVWEDPSLNTREKLLKIITK